jgi:hypothetical protein
MGSGTHYVLGLFFFEETVTEECYLNMLGNEIMPEIHLTGRGIPQWFMQNGATPHYRLLVRHWLDTISPEHGMGKTPPVEWAQWSAFIQYPDFSFWCFVKAQVYSKQINGLHICEQISEACASINAHLLQQSWRMCIISQTCSEHDEQYTEWILKFSMMHNFLDTYYTSTSSQIKR